MNLRILLPVFVLALLASTLPGNAATTPTVAGDRDAPITGRHLAVEKLRPTPYPDPTPRPRLDGYSNSGCLRYDEPCGPDEFEFVAEPGTLHFVHHNPLYNCCPDDIAVSLSVEGNVLELTEEEILTEGCDCMCCYDVEGTVVDLQPGMYTVEFCWFDNDFFEERCHVEEVEIPESGPRMGGYSNSGCLNFPDLCGPDEFEFTLEPGTLHVLHANALYNCCPDEIAISVSVEAGLIMLAEEEILTNPCYCVCCFEVEGTVIDLPAGSYLVELCWLDYNTDEVLCYEETIEIP